MNWVGRLKDLAGVGEFRVRSPERDAQTDQARIAALCKVLEETSAETSRERELLAERLQLATDQAASLVGTDDLEYLDRDEASEKALQETEFQIRRANERISQLRAFEAKLAEITETVNELLVRGSSAEPLTSSPHGSAARPG